MKKRRATMLLTKPMPLHEAYEKGVLADPKTIKQQLKEHADSPKQVNAFKLKTATVSNLDRGSLGGEGTEMLQVGPFFVAESVAQNDENRVEEDEIPKFDHDPLKALSKSIESSRPTQINVGDKSIDSDDLGKIDRSEDYVVEQTQLDIKRDDLN